MKIKGDIDIIGDTHGITGGMRYWARESDTPTLLHVGDYGAGFSNWERKTEELVNSLNKYEKNLFVIRGNHDDPSVFDGRSFLGSKNFGVYFIKDGTIAEWDGEKILFNGGGISLDRGTRIIGKEYWDGEEFQPIEVKEKIDHLVTHISLTCITGVQIDTPFVFKWASQGQDGDLINDLHAEQTILSKWINELVKVNKIKSWHYGHYHLSMKSEYNGIHCTCLDINEIRPFNRNEYENDY